MATATRRPTSPPASAPPRPPAQARHTAPPPHGGPPPQARNARRRRRLFWSLIVGIPLLAMAFAAAVLTLGGGRSAAPVAGPPLNRDTVLGRPDAPVEIEEWGDFQ